MKAAPARLLMFRRKRDEEEETPIVPPNKGYDWGWGRKPVAH